MASQPIPRYTPEEYLEQERKAEFKSEYYAGEIFAMAGAGRAHNLIVTNVVGELRAQLKRKPCETYSSDMKVAAGPSGLFSYPDVSVVCGEPRFHDARRDVLLNPTVIVEVLSRSTENYDRGLKFVQYRRLASLQSYVIIASTERRIEHSARQTDGTWNLSDVTDPGGVCILASLGYRLLMSEVYDRVAFETEIP